MLHGTCLQITINFSDFGNTVDSCYLNAGPSGAIEKPRPDDNICLSAMILKGSDQWCDVLSGVESDVRGKK